MKIQKVTDPAFRKYGQVLEGYDFTGLIKEMKHTPVPEDVIYVPSVEELEALDIMKDLQNKGYGGGAGPNGERQRSSFRSRSDTATAITRS